ncbi:DEAD/DEAH box helicase [candidate division KSB1 bacterium]|nr:DEAD/DEAH box helicase [candidate division KSB1 bacterium]
MKNILKYITPFCIEEIQNEIREAQGNEIFLIGKTNNERIVEQVTVLARGNEIAVPVVQKNAGAGDVMIHNHPGGELKPSMNDIHISSILGKIGVGSFIVNNDVDDIFVVVEPFDREEQRKLDADKISDILKPGHNISKKLKGYEYRPQQLDMIEEICLAFNQNTISVIEAGTGVGKSLAYLIPAVYWAVTNKEKCVISTNTINLQEQLINKDIPFLQSVLDISFDAVLVKGRNNYICLRKIEDMEREPELNILPEETNEIQMLIDWSKVTNDGSKSDLNFIPRYDVWEKVASESDTCTRAKCHNFKKCFVNKARRAANKAQILVVNHYLLFSDLSVRSLGMDISVLPPYKRLILDEAHHIEDVATHYFGGGITRAGVSRILGRLFQKGGKKGHFVILKARLLKLLAQINNPVLEDAVKRIDIDLIPNLDALNAINEEAMDALVSLVSSENQNGFGEIKLRVKPQVKDNEIWEKVVVEKCSNLIYQLKKFAGKIQKMIQRLEKCGISFDDRMISLLVEIEAQINRLLVARDVIESVLFEEDDEFVRWLEIKQQRNRYITRLRISPLDIGESMLKHVYERLDTIVMTSATLTIFGIRNRSEFEYLYNRIGLHLCKPDRMRTAVLPAPFNYRKQEIIAIPTDIPPPDLGSYRNALTDILRQTISITKGRAFILFTSYALLNRIYEQMEPFFDEEGILALKQGAATRHRLLDRFRQDKSSVLFGTDSFWEGVDVPGDALELVIITKLPFKVPTEPIIEARVEAIKSRGGNAFMEYSVPQAVIKLKQGVGRLIRSKRDIGAVVILDRRIVEKYYGKIFVASLPDGRIVQGSKNSVFNELTKFFKNNR